MIMKMTKHRNFILDRATPWVTMEYFSFGGHNFCNMFSS